MLAKKGSISATDSLHSPTICGIPFLHNEDYLNLNNLVNSLFDDVSGEVDKISQTAHCKRDRSSRCCKRFLVLLSPIALALLRLAWGISTTEIFARSFGSFYYTGLGVLILLFPEATSEFSFFTCSSTGYRTRTLPSLLHLCIHKKQVQCPTSLSVSLLCPTVPSQKAHLVKLLYIEHVAFNLIDL
ncbi:hypothetical protein T11_789 [Trichinella zimbabwensis]|uniref:Uncharacterized protein n=1 Tax=Trichinella zimbabwensis TaxID=268475 RepID=A0A0V1HUM1_9BILA|nr:hypothetical protein T11_10052 [Trichinella zimbabwensis]KRZ13285.1 hypothetical protein T11_789 [Trichinella zimbabwensis]